MENVRRRADDADDLALSFRIGMSSRGTKVADGRVTVRRVEPIMLRSKRSEEHIGRAGALWDMQ